MLIALSDAAWGFMGLLVVQAVALVGLYWQFHRKSKTLSSINNAVNHQPEGAKTLVQRVGDIETETGIHRRWEHQAFRALADHVGCQLPPVPTELDGTQN